MRRSARAPATMFSARAIVCRDDGRPRHSRSARGPTASSHRDVPAGDPTWVAADARASDRGSPRARPRRLDPYAAAPAGVRLLARGWSGSTDTAVRYRARRLPGYHATCGSGSASRATTSELRAWTARRAGGRVRGDSRSARVGGGANCPTPRHQGLQRLPHELRRLRVPLRGAVAGARAIGAGLARFTIARSGRWCRAST